MMRSTAAKVPSIFCFLLVIIFSSCQPESSIKKHPAIKDGFVDLSDWDFRTDGPVTLRGEWKYIWMHEEEDFYSPEFNDSQWKQFPVPEYWNFVILENQGYMLLRARVKLKGTDPLLFFLKSCSSACSIYLNGEPLLTLGTPGNSSKDFVPIKRPALATMPEADEYVFVWKISNFTNAGGGPVFAPVIGIPEKVYDLFSINIISEILVSGMLLIMFLYHFMLWIKQKEDRAILYFGFFCLLLIGHDNSVHHWIQQIFPQVNLFYQIHAIELLTLPLGSILLMLFLKELYPKEIETRYIKIFSILLMVFDLTLPLYSFTFENHLTMDIIAGILLIWLFFSILKALSRKREGAGFILVGFLAFTFGVTNEMMNNLFIDVNQSWISLSFIAIIVVYSVILSQRFSKATKLAERLSRNLEQEVELKTIELSSKTEALQDMDRQKNLFYQNITHELRTPLTLIIGHSEAVLNRSQELNSFYRDELLYIHRNAKKLHLLINQLLDLAKLDFKAMEFKPIAFDFVEFLEHIYLGFKSLAKVKDINLQLNIEEKVGIVNLDIQKIEDIFTNLLSNAFKFTDNGGSITITINIIEENRLKVDVLDTGIGIAQDELSHIFDRFHQVDGTTSRKYEGTGIGLSLAKKYAELHEGTILVTSTLGAGSCFSVILPKYVMPEDEFNDQPALQNFEEYDFSGLASQNYFDYLVDQEGTGQGNPMGESVKEVSKTFSILIVENNGDLRNFLKTSLSPSYNVYTAGNGIQALEVLKQQIHVDLVISDIMMGEMDGYQLYEALQQEERTRGIPFIFITAKASLEDQLKGLEQGAIDYITKPFSIKTLLAKVKSVLRFNKLRNVLHERERFAALGKLVVAISHEILNPLAGMSGPVYFLKKKMAAIKTDDTSRINEALDFLDTNIDRIDKIIKRLRSLNRYGASDKEVVQLKYILLDVIILLKNKIKDEIDIKLSIDDDFSLSVNPGALSHVLLNLISNACDAIEGEGIIEITAEKRGDDDIIISVSDTGKGIKVEDLPSIFDLYFTTKPFNEGSGFGLYFVKDLLLKMGWSIRVESEIGKGSTFIISNPDQ